MSISDCPLRPLWPNLRYCPWPGPLHCGLPGADQDRLPAATRAARGQGRELRPTGPFCLALLSSTLAFVTNIGKHFDSLFLEPLEDTARYAGLLLAPAFFALQRKKELNMLFWLIFGVH